MRNVTFIYLLITFLIFSYKSFSQKNKDIQGIELSYFKLFESGKGVPKINSRSYDSSFYAFTSRYIFAELYVKNKNYNIKDESYKVLWKWKSLDNSINMKGKMEANFNVKKEWEYAYIERGWGWEYSGNWQPGEYLVEVYVNKTKFSESKFTIIGIESKTTSSYTDENVETINQIIKSSNKGHISMGLAYLYGSGVEKNYDAALSMFKTAFNSGSRLAAFYIGLMHYYGYGVVQDYSQAYNWFGESPDTLAEANFYLGYMYLHGQYVAVDYTLADKFLLVAAEDGISQAQSSLGLSYMLQASDPKQFLIDGYEKAYYWLYIAAAQNDYDGKRFLETMQTMLHGEEREKVEQSAIDFLNSFEFNTTTYLHQAVIDQDLSKVEQLIKYGMDIDIREKTYNMTPLHYAVARNNVSMVKYLIDNNAYINVLGTEGTPLHMASQYYNDTTIVSMLIHSGALLNVFDSKNRTALDRAIEAGNNIAINYLKQLGAKDSKELITENEEVLFIESFDKNSNNWSNNKDWEYYGTWFDNGFYYIDSKNEMCALENISFPENVGTNYSIQLKCKWLGGKINQSYGLVVGQSRTNYYAFEICASGWASVIKRAEDGTTTLIEWTKNAALASQGKTINSLKIVIKGNKAFFKVNNFELGSVEYESDVPKIFGIRVCDLQEVAFDELRACKLKN